MSINGPELTIKNAAPAIWEKMWVDQVNLGIMPYYMFVARNTGSHRFFFIPLVKAFDIYRKAYSAVSGLARTVRGPIMSALHGKIKIDGIPEINGKKYISMSFAQGRNADWVKRPFFSKYDENACWINELEPAFGDGAFFFERDECDSSGQDDFNDESEVLPSVMALG